MTSSEMFVSNVPAVFAFAVLLASPSTLLSQSSEGPIDQVTGTQKEQISCSDNDCVRLEFDPAMVNEKIRDLMADQAGKIVIRLDDRQIGLKDEPFQPIMDVLREISKRDGTIVIEPVYIGIRDMMPFEIPVIKDFLSVGISIYRRVVNYIQYRHTKNYHAKVLYNPADHNVLLVYFVNKAYGDICTTLKSKCEEIEYLDDDTFDQMLSQRLKDAKEKGYSVRVVFNKTPAQLPEASIDLATLKAMNQSARMYKWLIVSGKTEKKKVTKERFIPIGLVASVIDYTLTAYDAVKTVIMYLPAREMKAEVTYTGEESGGQMQTVVFTPGNE